MIHSEAKPLKAYFGRRKPAISKFDWNSAATHTSSPDFSNITWVRFLQCVFLPGPPFQTLDMVKITWFFGFYDAHITHFALFQTGFRYGAFRSHFFSKLGKPRMGISLNSPGSFSETKKGHGLISPN